MYETMQVPRLPERSRALALVGLILMLAPPPAEAEPAKPDQLVMRDWPGPWAEAMAATAAKTFTERTGIPIVIDTRPDDAMSMLVRTAIAQHRQPPIDIFYELRTAAYKDQHRDVMDPLDPAVIPHLADMLPAAKPDSADGGWPFVNVGNAVMTLLYRKSRFPDGPPQSFNVMFDPAFKGRIMLYSVSATTLEIVALANHWSIPGEVDKIWAFIAAKVKPMDPILGDDPEVVGGFQRNEIDLAVTFPIVAINLDAAGADIGWTRPKEGVLGVPETAWVPRGLPASNRYWAMRFIDTLLTPEVLSAYCIHLRIPCYGKTMSVPEAARDDASFPKTPEELAAVYTTPFDVLAAHQSEWDARFDEIMK